MSFSIVLNSIYFYENTNNTNVIYSCDFTNMEEGKYEVAFSYRGQNNHLDSTDLCLVNVDFGSFRKVYQAGNETFNKYTYFLGTLHNSYNTATDAYLYANLNDNQPVYIDNKPSNGFISVNLTNPNGTPFITHGAQPPADYILTLSFKKI